MWSTTREESLGTASPVLDRMRRKENELHSIMEDILKITMNDDLEFQVQVTVSQRERMNETDELEVQK